MSKATKFFCLECDVLLMRLYGKPDLASVRGEAPAAAGVEGDPKETYTCPECGKVVVRQANGELVETHA